MQCDKLASEGAFAEQAAFESLKELYSVHQRPTSANPSFPRQNMMSGSELLVDRTADVGSELLKMPS